MSAAPKNGKPFEPGHAKVGGRVKGSRNKLSADFIAALAKAFEEQGEAAIKIVAKEEPKDFLRVIASIIPRELDIHDNRLKEFSDDDVDAIIADYRERIARRASATGTGGAGNVRDGTPETTH